MQELMEKIAFVRGLNETISKYIDNVDSIKYHVFKHKEKGWVDEYLFIGFKGSGYLVRNCSGNSKIAILREIARLIVGGYYEENKTYESHLKNKDWEQII